MGLKLNSTVVAEADSGNDRIWDATAVDEAQIGLTVAWIDPRLTNYQNAGVGLVKMMSGTASRIAHGLQQLSKPTFPRWLQHY